MSNMIAIGTRVRAISDNPDFNGKVGTVSRHVGHFYEVDFDFVGKPGENWPNGGTWGDQHLTVLLPETVERLQSDLVEADAEIARLGEYARAREAEIAQHEENYSSLADDYREAKAVAEVLAAEAENLRKSWRYALSLLDERSRDRANGYYDATFGFGGGS